MRAFHGEIHPAPAAFLFCLKGGVRLREADVVFRRYHCGVGDAGRHVGHCRRACQRTAHGRPGAGYFRGASPTPPRHARRLSRPPRPARGRRALYFFCRTKFIHWRGPRGDFLPRQSVHCAKNSRRPAGPRLSPGRGRRIQQTRFSERPHGPEPGRGGDGSHPCPQRTRPDGRKSSAARRARATDGFAYLSIGQYLGND